MIGKPIPRKTAMLCSLLAIIVLVGSYALIANNHQNKFPDDRTIPTWNQLWEGLVFLCRQPTAAESDTSDLLAAALAGTDMNTKAEAESRGFFEGRILWHATLATLGRLLTGLLLGVVSGAVVGILMGCYLKIDAALSPVIYFASRIIPTAAMPIFFKVAGIEFEMYVAMIVFGSMPVVTLTVSKYVQEFPEELRNKAYTLGASNAEVVTTAIYPYLLPRLIELAILMIGPALVYLIAAEHIVAGEGFGYRIRVLTRATRFEVVYPLIVILTFYAAIMTVGLKFMLKKLCPWYKAERG